MLILRKPPFPLSIDLTGEFNSGVGYILSVMDEYAVDLYQTSAMCDTEGVITLELPDYFSRYDAEYRLEVNVLDSYPDPVILGDLVYIDTLTITRPYLDPSTFVDDTVDEAQAATYEALARAIIDSVTGGFRYEREIYDTTGIGADYISIPYRLNRIVRVYENDVKIFDAENTDPDWSNIKEFRVTADRTAAIVSVPNTNGINRYQSKPFRRRYGASDSFSEGNWTDSPNFTEAVYDTKTFVDMTGDGAMFPNGWDYVFVLEVGWPVVPEDIKTATGMLVNDLKCGNNPYFNSYIKEYESDQFTLKFDAKAFSSTGNRLVDKILENYPRPITGLGVL